MAKKEKTMSLGCLRTGCRKSLEEYLPVPSEEQRRILQLAAKTRNISLRISENVLAALKWKAGRRGTPLSDADLKPFSINSAQTRLVDAMR